MKSGKAVIREGIISHNIALRYFPCLFTFASPNQKKIIHKCSANQELEVANVCKTKRELLIILQHICARKKNKLIKLRKNRVNSVRIMLAIIAFPFFPFLIDRQTVKNRAR